MLFISTYYDLTKDDRIKKIINKYKKTEQGEKVSEFVLKADYSKLTSSVIKPTKKLVKKKRY